MRPVAEPPVNYLLYKVYNVEHSTYASAFSRVLGNFFVAYLTHVYGAFCAVGHETGEWNFFAGQAAAIIFESLVQGTWSWLGLPRGKVLTRTVGYLWTASFVSYSAMCWMEEQLRAGYWQQDLLSRSIAAPLLEHFSSTWESCV